MAVFIPNDGTHCQGEFQQDPGANAKPDAELCDVACADVDECRITGVCGDGAQCSNLPGSFECSCQLGYRVRDGKEPFDPRRDEASCQGKATRLEEAPPWLKSALAASSVVDCGQPASAKDAVLLSVTGTTFSGVATFGCDAGFQRTGGDSSSVCGADGLWTPASIRCEGKDMQPIHPIQRHSN